MAIQAEGNMTQTAFFTIANILTAARLVLLPVVITGVVTHHGWVAVIAMAAVVLTDLLDGRIARRMKQQSAFGGTLDSTIDFVLIYSLFIAFYAAERLEVYQFAILYVMMLTTFLMQLVAMATGASEGVMRTRTGKITGALQYGYILFLVVREVLPMEAWVATLNFVWFLTLAGMICLSSSGAIIRLRRMISTNQ